MISTRFIKLSLFIVVSIISLIIIVIKFTQTQKNVIQDSQHPHEQDINRNINLELNEEFNDFLKTKTNKNNTLKDLSNFPWIFYKVNSTEKSNEVNKECKNFPKLKDISFNNFYWQKSIFNGVEFYLFGAYLDIRPKNGPVVRILTMTNALNFEIPTKCLLWTENEAIETNLTWKTYLWSEEWGHQTNDLYQPFLINCAIPEMFKNEVIYSVSLIGSDICETPSNNLYVNYDYGLEKKTKIGVCFNGFNLVDEYSIKLLEWIELIKLLGGSNIYIYNLETHQNISRLLNYYEKKGFVEVIESSLPGKYPNHKYLQNIYLEKYPGVKELVEMIYYNDCFYKNIYNHDYILFLDINELIIPNNSDWISLLASTLDNSSYYYTKEVYFFGNNKSIDGVPNYMKKLKSIYRLKDVLGLSGKSFQSTRDVLVAYNKFPLKCFSKNGRCDGVQIDTNLARLFSYKESCLEILNECEEMENLVLDESLWKYKERLINHLSESIKELDLE
ncbi:uncharacterized protein [Onthophagus taurus]|uniref:uncharacterized protein n=1 Tax=Onthophagus taurus TaxID=166361 RepID=UPI0039BE3942